MQRFSFIVILALALFASGKSLAEPAVAIETTLYFGMALGEGGKVSDEEWSDFLTRVVTPRFPDGFTVIDAYGQWRDPADANAPIVREATKILVVVHPATAETEASIAEVKSIYRDLFAQKSVFHTEAPVRVME